METLTRVAEKIKTAGQREFWTDMAVLAIVILVAISSFMLGRLSAREDDSSRLRIYDGSGNEMSK